MTEELDTNGLIEALSDLGHQAAHELERFIKIYDLKFDRTNFIDIYKAKIMRMDEVHR